MRNITASLGQIFHASNIFIINVLCFIYYNNFAMKRNFEEVMITVLKKIFCSENVEK